MTDYEDGCKQQSGGTIFPQPPWPQPPFPKLQKTYTVRIFPENETTLVEYVGVTHVFWEAKGTVLVLCLPEKHAHWLREWIRHYDIIEN